MPGPGSSNTVLQSPNNPLGGEQAFAAMGLEQGNVAGQAAKTALFDPRTRLANLENEKQQIRDKIAAYNRDYAYIESGAASNAGDVAAINRRSTIPGQIAQEEGNLRALDSLKPQLERQALRLGEQEELNLRVQKRLDDFISGRDIGVSAEERALITQGIQGISQDVATTRGLNRSDVPVMQAVAPTVANALLNQANANRALFTGITQFQQGLDLSGRQLQAGLAGQNPAAGLAGAYLGARGSSYDTQQQGRYGAVDYAGLTGNVLGGAGLGLYGLSSAGLIGGGAAATTPVATAATGAAMAAGCWIAEAIYGPNAPETGVVRWWLNTHFVKRPVGRVVMTCYRKYGRQIAECVQRWNWLKLVLRPLFNVALRHGLAAS